MNFNEAKARHAQLVDELRQHDHAYYVLAQPTILDHEYDRLYQELLDLEKEDPKLVTPDSPSQRVGGQPVDGFARVKHLLPMLSLEKIKASKHPDEKEEPDAERRKRLQDENTLQELKDFDATIRKQLGKRLIVYVVEAKVDGVSIGIHYKNGKLALGVTRGDGTTGDDITSNVKTIRGIPLELRLKHPPALLEVRGEAYIPNADFEKLNAKLESAGERAFPNARNATAGTLKQLDPGMVAQRPIRAVFYAVGACEGIAFATHAEVLESLKKFGLPTQSLWWLCKGVEEVFECYKSQVVCGYNEQLDLRSKLPYEIDGIVLKVNDLADWQRIPPKARAPGYAIVHKPIPWITPAETVLKAITVQVGRTGVLTPVADLEPVSIQGSTIARATLHNEDEIRRKDIRIGDTVRVRKAGMVIPEVYEVVKSKRPQEAKEFNFYKHVHGKCPACGGSIVRDPKFVAWRCQNIAGCPAQSVRRLEFLAQRSALDIEELGEVVAEKLVESGMIREPLDLFDITAEQLAGLNLGTQEERRVFGEKNATKVVEALERAKALPLSRWFHALGIPNVGEITAYKIAKLHNKLADFADSETLKNVLDLAERVREAKEASPDSVDHMPPIRRARIDKEKERTALGMQSMEKLSPTELQKIQAKRQRLESEIKSLREGEPEEWKARCLQQQNLNSQIESLVACLKQAGVNPNVVPTGKKKTRYGQKAPPVLDVTTEISPEAARSILAFFNSQAGKKILERLKGLGISATGGKAASTGEGLPQAFAEKTFVLTGTLGSMTRDEAAEEIRKRGGSVTSSVTKNTTFLVIGEEPGATKSEQARTLGVPTLNEKAFLEMLGPPKVAKSEPKQRELL